MRVSVNTVMEAYADLENMGLIEARPQSGYYVKVPRLEEAVGFRRKPAMDYTAPGNVVLGEVPLQIMRALTNPSLVPLGVGIPNTDLLPADKLSREPHSSINW